jgi:hypothetical protein
MQPRREYQGGRKAVNITESGRKGKFIDRQKQTKQAGRQVGRKTDKQGKSGSRARKKGAGKSMEGDPTPMQVVRQAKQRKSRQGRQKQAGKMRQADIKSDASKCMHVKETKASIGLAGKQPSKHKETGK